MEHLQLFLYIVMLATGFAGVTVTGILWYRIRERLLLVVMFVIGAFALGLLFFLALFYLRSIVVYTLSFGGLVHLINLAIVLAIYGGIALIVRWVSPQSPRWLLSLLILAVAASYLLFGVMPTVDERAVAWVSDRAAIALIVSVTVASLYLAYCGRRLQGAVGGVAHPTVRFLIRGLGLMLIGFSVLSIAATAVVEALRIDLTPTVALNFILYLAWNVVAITGFIRYLTHPVDIFADGGVPEEALKRYGISPREAEVITHLSRGLSNREIAERLRVSFTTVRTHVYNVFKKTGAATRVELLRILSGG